MTGLQKNGFHDVAGTHMQRNPLKTGE